MDRNFQEQNDFLLHFFAVRIVYYGKNENPEKHF
jgi:hypothetical protein